MLKQKNAKLVNLTLIIALMFSSCSGEKDPIASSNGSSKETSTSTQEESMIDDFTSEDTDSSESDLDSSQTDPDSSREISETTKSSTPNTSSASSAVKKTYYDGTQGPADDFTLKGAYIGWQFKDTQGWRSSTNSKLTVTDERLIVSGTNANPTVETPAGLQIPADAVRTIEFRLKSSKASSVKFYWKRSGGSFSESSSVSIPIKNDNKEHDYQIDLSRKKEWGGKVDQLRFVFVDSAGGTVSWQYCKATGVYIAPFVVLQGNMAEDIKILNEVKASYESKNKTSLVGYSYVLEYLAHGDASGNYEVSSMLSNPNYFAQLCEIVGMPVALWLRGDPWGGNGGPQSAGGHLMQDDTAVMWNQNTTGQFAYHNSETGFIYLSLAPTDLEGKQTEYWTLTEKLLGKVATLVNQLIQEKPGYVLGITLTSELKYNAESGVILDYNPHTILDFKNWCQAKYSTVQALNTAMGTNFSTYALRSTDYNPSTVENAGGFDAPRDRTNQKFFDLWITYREELVQRTVQRMADVCESKMDTKYVFTHQLCYDQGDNTAIANICSPIESGYATNANMGIDMFTHDFTQGNFSRINKLLGNDYTKSWGIPEWLHSGASASKVFDSLKLAHTNGIKFLSPFAWGATRYGTAEGVQLEFKDSKATKGIQQYINYLDAMAN